MDTLRGAAVLGVVVMHAELAVVAATGEELAAVHAVNGWLGPVRMPVLVLLSGLLVPRSLAKGLRHHLRGKARHILWPYLVWGLLDVTHVQLDALVLGRPLRWELLAQLFYDPHTYLWFLGYLFVFHVVAGLLPTAARTSAIPVCLLAGDLPGESLDKLVGLLGWFLVGDLAARALAGRVPPRLVAAADRVHVAPLAAVGRQSLVFYACHLLVLTYVVGAAYAGGLRDPGALHLVSVALTLAAGALLVRARGRGRLRWLFAWPGSYLGHSVTPNRLHVTRRRINVGV